MFACHKNTPKVVNIAKYTRTKVKSMKKRILVLIISVSFETGIFMKKMSGQPVVKGYHD